jgi:hypothetical protein
MKTYHSKLQQSLLCAFNTFNSIIPGISKDLYIMTRTLKEMSKKNLYLKCFNNIIIIVLQTTVPFQYQEMLMLMLQQRIYVVNVALHILQYMCQVRVSSAHILYLNSF